MTQDFEALTPNLLARTIETVEGGGMVVMLLSTLTSLTQLYSLAMDAHARFSTPSHRDVTGNSSLASLQTLTGILSMCLLFHACHEIMHRRCMQIMHRLQRSQQHWP